MENGNTYNFNNLHVKRKDYLGEENLWLLTHAYFKEEILDGKSYIVGDARLYSPDLLEPGECAYLILEQTIQLATNSLKPNLAADFEMKAFPNPYMQEITFELKMNESTIALFTSLTAKDKKYFSMNVWVISPVTK